MSAPEASQLVCPAEELEKKSALLGVALRGLMDIADGSDVETDRHALPVFELWCEVDTRLRAFTAAALGKEAK
jgi:hypothetical protein